MKYSDPQEFFAALDQHLRTEVEKSRRAQDLQNLKIELAIERFLSRIGPDLGAIKGGTAAMLMVPNAPHTRDVDLVISESLVKSLGLNDMHPDKRADALADLLQEHLRKGPKGDFFRFKYEDAFAITDLKPGHTCARINFTVMVGKSELHVLQVDVALQDGELPTISMPGRHMLQFAGIENPELRTVTAEYLFADKVTLYLEEHAKPDAERVKDIVHAALIASSRSLNLEELAKILANRALYREVVEKLAEKIPEPPKRWKDQFEELREQAESSMTMQDAIEIIEKTVSRVRDAALKIARKTTGKN